MAKDHKFLAEVSDLVQAELTKFLSEAFPIAKVTSEYLPGPDEEDYLRTTVFFEDGHAELDPRALSRFTRHMDKICTERGFYRPIIDYANKSEIPV